MGGFTTYRMTEAIASAHSLLSNTNTSREWVDIFLLAASALPLRPHSVQSKEEIGTHSQFRAFDLQQNDLRSRGSKNNCESTLPTASCMASLLASCPEEQLAWQRLISWASVEASKPREVAAGDALKALRARVAAAVACDVSKVPTVDSSHCVMCGPLDNGQQCPCTCGELPPLKKALLESKRSGKHVRINPLPHIRLVERLDLVDIVGDIRDPHNPNFGAMGVARDLRLSQFACEFTEQVAIECFSRWKLLVAGRASTT